MVVASQLRPGMAIRHDNEIYKVVSAEYHPGQGKMGGVTHARLQNLSTGAFWEHGFRSDLKLEDLPLEKIPMDFLYRDGEQCVFMNPESFEQVELTASTVGPQSDLLQEQMRVAVEFVEGRPVSVLFPEILEVQVAETAPPVHQQQDSTWKQAKLENGVEIMVPQFIKVGDTIRLGVQKLEYMDRAKSSGK